MDSREKELLKLKTSTKDIETEVTMLLQSLQWDPKKLLEETSTATCQYDTNHKMPQGSLEVHESNCRLQSLGYTQNDELLPDPPNEGAHSLVKLSYNEIQQIINEASAKDPLFKKGGVSHQPLSMSRLQVVFTADERRALHDAVVAAVPSCHDLRDLALASSNEDATQGNAAKSRMEILAELRNMKRRRTKYRVAAKTKNYSDVLRDVIKSQMESYTEAVASTTGKVNEVKNYNQSGDTINRDNTTNRRSSKYDAVKSRDYDRRETSYDKRHNSNTHYGRRDNTFNTNTAKRSYDAHCEETGSEGRNESSSKRYKDRHDRSDSRKRRHENHRETNHKTRDEYNRHCSSIGRYDSTRNKIKVEGEENGQRYSTDRIENKEKTHKRRGYDYEDDNKYSKSKHKEDRHSKDCCKSEKSRFDKSSSRRSRSKSKGRPLEGRRRHRDEDRRYGGQSEDSYYKPSLEIKKEPYDGY